MTEPGGDTPPPPLQFETVEGIQPAAPGCTRCGTPLNTEYHELNGHPVCAVCRAKEEAVFQQDQRWGRFVTAAVYGAGAALVGAILYWAFVKITNIELALMAIGVGWLVGRAVMKGSNLRGGRRYQILALVLTYLSITFSYGALILEGFIKSRPKTEAAQVEPTRTPSAAGAALAVGGLLLLMLVSPFLAGFSNILGWVIIAIGLFEAWKQTRAVPTTYPSGTF